MEFREYYTLEVGANLKYNNSNFAEENSAKISELVKQFHEARKKAKELLEEAKLKVEEIIEKGGDKNGKI